MLPSQMIIATALHSLPLYIGSSDNAAVLLYVTSLTRHSKTSKASLEPLADIISSKYNTLPVNKSVCAQP